MFRLLDRLDFLLSEAFVALRRNSWMTVSSILTVAISMFLMGGLVYAYYRVSQYAESLPSKFEMRVFMQEDVSREQVQEAEKAIRGVRGVKQVEWIPKEEAWERQKQEIPEIIEDLENPLPDAFKVVFSDLERARSVIAKVKELPGVDPKGVVYLDEERQLLSEALSLIEKVGTFLGGLMLLTSGMLIYNTIRLAMIARKGEIRIMQLMGVAGTTLVAPFLIEGVFQGGMGGLLASFLLATSHMSLAKMLESFSAIGKLAPFPVLKATFALGVVGAFFGFICSLLAVFEFGGKR